jgi:hypothetical protein
MCAALRCLRDGQAHDLLILRPEAYEIFLTLRPADAERVLGYLYLPEGSSPRVALVVDTNLGEWPEDEEELLPLP